MCRLLEREGASSGCDAIFTRSSLRCELDGNHFRSLNDVFLFVALSIDLHTGYDGMATMERVHTCYSETVFEVTGDIYLRIYTEKELQSLEEKIKMIK